MINVTIKLGLVDSFSEKDRDYFSVIFSSNRTQDDVYLSKVYGLRRQPAARVPRWWLAQPHLMRTSERNEPVSVSTGWERMFHEPPTSLSPT